MCKCGWSGQPFRRGDPLHLTSKVRNPFLAPFADGPGVVFVKQTAPHHLHDAAAILTIARALPMRADTRFEPVVPRAVTEYSLVDLVHRYRLWRSGRAGHLPYPSSPSFFENTERLAEDFSPDEVREFEAQKALVKELRERPVRTTVPLEAIENTRDFLLALEAEQERRSTSPALRVPSRGSLGFIGRPEFLLCDQGCEDVLERAGYPGRFQWTKGLAPGPRDADVYRADA